MMRKGFLRANTDIILIFALTAFIRALVCLSTDNEWGDADARVILSAEWARAPSLLPSGVWLPLHFYATGLLTWIFGNPIVAGKTLSFITGSLTVIPLFQLTQRLFDRATAVVAGIFFAIYGTHIGVSSVVLSEAPFALFTVWGLDVFFRAHALETPRLRDFLWSGALLAIAGGLRQEAWPLVGILTAYLLWKPRTRAYAIPFAAIGLSTVALWDIAQVMQGEAWLSPLTAVSRSKNLEALHHRFDAAENVLRWAWIFVRSPGLLISTLALTGLFLALRQRLRGDLGLIALLLIGPFVILSLIKPQWAPQARYTLIFVILVLPYAAAAAIAVFQPRYQMYLVIPVVVLFSIVSQGFAYHPRSHLFLPVNDYNANDVAAWHWMAANAGANSVIVVEDTDWRGPGLISHSGLYTHRNHIVFDFDGPAVLEKIVAGEPLPLLLVLHSPLSKWPFLQRLHPQLLFRNESYQILRIDSR
jgi:4-amino-4-deoxy-L-arabinose transferase-like glycosyltransferase